MPIESLANSKISYRRRQCEYSRARRATPGQVVGPESVVARLLPVDGTAARRRIPILDCPVMMTH